MTLKNSLKLNQNMMINSNLQQAIKLLQFSSLELSAYINNELQDNPLLQIEEEKIDEDNYNIDSNLRFEKVINKNDIEYDFENNAYSKTLREHVLEQIYLDIKDNKRRIIAFNITDYLEDSGYIYEEDLQLVAKKLSIEYKEVENTLFLLQKFEPAGIFARNLMECLKIQMVDKNIFDDKYHMIISRLDLIASGKINKVKQDCDLSDDEFILRMKQIKSLDPKPGSLFIKDLDNYSSPDVYVKDIKGNLVLELNHNIIPKILLNKKYYADIKQTSLNKIDKQYLSDKFSSANFLIRALDQRSNTLLIVAKEIVDFQKDFFKYGIEFLKPMTIKDISSKVNLHESSISRITSNKIISTPLGVYDLKFFFSSKIEANNFDNDISSKSVKNLLKKIIENERIPLSDNSISDLLKNNYNINIARRTITKYRESLGIESASVRKNKFSFKNSTKIKI